MSDHRKDCTCLGTCRGAEGLGAGWRCALEKPMSGEDTREALAEAWWRGRRSANERQGEWAGPELRERCAKDIADLAASRLAAPVGEQAMPPIEVGDWYRYRTRPGTALQEWRIEQSRYPMAREWVEAIIEIRKADGRVWRRDG